MRSRERHGRSLVRHRLSANPAPFQNCRRRPTQASNSDSFALIATKIAAVTARIWQVLTNRRLNLHYPASSEGPQFFDRNRQAIEELSNLPFISIGLGFRGGLDECLRVFHSADDSLHLQ